MFGWVLFLGLCALLAAVLGFMALAGMFAFIAKLVFLLLLAVMVMSLISHMLQDDGKGAR